MEEDGPNREQEKNKNLGQSIGQDKLGVHLVRVVLSDEVEGQNGNSENCDEPVDAGALLGREDSPPLDGTVSHQHCEV